MGPDRTRVRSSRHKLEADQLTDALAYGLEALGERLNDLAVRQAQSAAGVMLRGARVAQIGTGGTTRPTTAAGSLIGWSLHNTGATPVQVNFRDGVDAAGDLIAAIALAVGESTRDNWGPGGLSIQRGLFVEVTGGTIEGAAYLRGPE